MIPYWLIWLQLKADRHAFTLLERALIGGAVAVAILGLFEVTSTRL